MYRSVFKETARYSSTVLYTVYDSDLRNMTIGMAWASVITFVFRMKTEITVIYLIIS